MNKDDPDYEICKAMAVAYALASSPRDVPMVSYEHMKPVLAVVRGLDK